MLCVTPSALQTSLRYLNGTADLKGSTHRRRLSPLVVVPDAPARLAIAAEDAKGRVLEAPVARCHPAPHFLGLNPGVHPRPRGFDSVMAAVLTYPQKNYNINSIQCIEV